jgi:hypothetical protein
MGEADDRVRTPREHPDRHWVAPSGRIDGIDPEGGERNCRPHLAADGSGFVLRGAGLEQGAPDLRDRRRLGDEPRGEIAPAGERAELLHLGNVGEGLAG